jgi:hypothetical protein
MEDWRLRIVMGIRVVGYIVGVFKSRRWSEKNSSWANIHYVLVFVSWTGLQLFAIASYWTKAKDDLFFTSEPEKGDSFFSFGQNKTRGVKEHILSLSQLLCTPILLAASPCMDGSILLSNFIRDRYV